MGGDVLMIKIQYFIFKINDQLRILYELIQIMKATLLFVIMLAIGASANTLQIQYGTYIAKSSQGNGILNIRCIGGSNNYEYSYNNLPKGWSSSGQNIIIPNLAALFNRYHQINIEIRDLETNFVLNGNIILIINGFRIDVNSAGAGSVVLVRPPSRSNQFGSTNLNSAGSSTINTQFTSSTSAFSTDVSSLYNSYPGLPINNKIVAPPNTVSRPAGPPRIPNPTPQIIANAQATYNFERDANKITVDDVKRRAIFNRQINANKAVANLITIIQRLTANVNAAKNDIVILENIVKETQQGDRNCDQEVFSYSNTQAKITNAIADRENALLIANGKIQQVENDLKAFEKEYVALKLERSRVQRQRSPNSSKLTSLQRQLESCERKRKDAVDDLNKINSQIRALNSEIKDAEESSKSAPQRIAQIDRQDIINNRKIADLRRQLADAEQQKSQLARDRKKYEEQIRQSQLQVNRLRREIAVLKAKIPTLQSEIDSIDRGCERIRNQLRKFRNDLASLESDFNTVLTEIEAQEALINTKEQQLVALRKSIDDLPNEIKLLRAESNRVDTALRRQYFICQAAIEEVRKAEENLAAMRIKLDRETQFLTEANQNLESARAEKELADIAVQQIIQTYTSALPFSVLPSFSSTSRVQSNNQYQYEEYAIGDLNNYLSTAYKTSAAPARDDSLTLLYPLSQTTLNTVVNGGTSGRVNPSRSYNPPPNNLYNFQCDRSSGRQVTGSGQIYSVQPGMIQVQTARGLTNLRLSGCSNLQSVRSNQVLNRNDNVYFRGSDIGRNTIQLSSMTCV